MYPKLSLESFTMQAIELNSSLEARLAPFPNESSEITLAQGIFKSSSLVSGIGSLACGRITARGIISSRAFAPVVIINARVSRVSCVRLDLEL